MSQPYEYAHDHTQDPNYAFVDDVADDDDPHEEEPNGEENMYRNREITADLAEEDERREYGGR